MAFSIVVTKRPSLPIIEVFYDWQTLPYKHWIFFLLSYPLYSETFLQLWQINTPFQSVTFFPTVLILKGVTICLNIPLKLKGSGKISNFSLGLPRCSQLSFKFFKHWICNNQLHKNVWTCIHAHIHTLYVLTDMTSVWNWLLGILGSLHFLTMLCGKYIGLYQVGLFSVGGLKSKKPSSKCMLDKNLSLGVMCITFMVFCTFFSKHV